jgi:hypothetical protein
VEEILLCDIETPCVGQYWVGKWKSSHISIIKIIKIDDNVIYYKYYLNHPSFENILKKMSPSRTLNDFLIDFRPSTDEEKQRIENEEIIKDIIE